MSNVNEVCRCCDPRYLHWEGTGKCLARDCQCQSFDRDELATFAAEISMGVQRNRERPFIPKKREASAGEREQQRKLGS